MHACCHRYVGGDHISLNTAILELPTITPLPSLICIDDLSSLLSASSQQVPGAGGWLLTIFAPIIYLLTCGCVMCQCVI
jgi:hypothetical protein